jgi:glutamine cyclotransferase
MVGIVTFALVAGLLSPVLDSKLGDGAPSAVGRTCVAPRARLYGTAANLGVIEIDPIKGSILNTFAPPVAAGVADGLAYDGRHVYYLSGSRAPNALYQLDPGTGATSANQSLPASAFRNGLAALDGYVYILDWSAITQDITVWDPEQRRVVRTLDLDGANADLPAISGGLAAIRGPDALLVTTAMSNELLEIHPATGRVTRRFTHGLAGALGVAAIGNRIYIGTNTSAELRIFSRAGQLQTSLPVSGAIGFQSLAGDALAAARCTVHLPMGLRLGR